MNELKEKERENTHTQCTGKEEKKKRATTITM
jgi:hypothetical protein